MVSVAPGVDLAIDEGTGRQPTVLLVHGLSSNRKTWVGVERLLSRDGRAWVAVDQRGHGGSSKVDDGYDFETVTGDLAVLIGDTGPVVAVGQSWGANVVVELAARHPELVSAVVCVDGGFIRLRDGFATWEEAERALTPPDFSGMTLVGLREVAGDRFHGWPEEGIAGQLGNFEVLGDGTIRPWLTWPRHRRILQAMWDQDPVESARSITVPVSVIAVGREEGGRAERVERLVEACHNGRVTWVEGDHDIHVQQPALVYRAITEIIGS